MKNLNALSAPKDAKICECKLYRRKRDNNRWFLDIVVERNIPEKTRYQNVIGIDTGIRHFATSVDLASSDDDGKTKFFGKDLNHVRGHYFWLRRKLGVKKALDTIKKIGSHEKRITNDIVHNISRQIVNRALETDALIFLGDIKHLRSRNQNTRGRKFNRKLSGFQYYKLTQYITYKAALAGIKVIQVSEAGKGNIAENAIRKVHGRHKDYSYARSVGKRMLIDAAFNIAYRALGYISKVGVTVNTLKTFASVDRNAMMTKEATYFNRR